MVIHIVGHFIICLYYPSSFHYPNARHVSDFVVCVDPLIKTLHSRVSDSLSINAAVYCISILVLSNDVLSDRKETCKMISLCLSSRFLKHLLDDLC